MDKANKNDFRRYLATAGIFLVAMLGITAAVNVVIDPYLRFGTTRTRGLNALKPQAIKQVRMAKAYEVTRRKYKTLLLGNSRVDIGINPDSKQFEDTLQPVYNLGQPGTGTSSALHYLQHAIAHSKPKQILLGVDFLYYLEPRRPPGAAPIEAPSASPRLNHHDVPDLTRYKQNLLDTFAAGLSLSGLKDSILTMSAQHSEFSADLTASGWNTGTAFRRLVQAEGQRSLFDQKNSEYLAKCEHKVAPPLDESAELAALRELLKVCEDNSITVHIFTHPYHAEILNIFRDSGQFENFENWKRHIVSIANSFDIGVYDFACYCNFTLEGVPAESDRSTLMKWYWESGHYRSTLGDEMLGEMLAPTDSVAPGEFGYLMTPENVETHLEKIDAESRKAPDASIQRTVSQ